MYREGIEVLEIREIGKNRNWAKRKSGKRRIFWENGNRGEKNRGKEKTGPDRVLRWSKLVNFSVDIFRQRTNSNLQPGLRSIRLSVPEE